MTALVTSLQRAVKWGDAAGWNAGERQVGAVRRIPVEGLTLGHQEETKGGASAALTDESAKGRAIVLIPAALKPSAPVDVLLHLHGYAETTGRPYAGWRERKAGAGAGAKAGTVRDVAQDRIAQQIEEAKQTQLIGVLPQGGERSQFGAMMSDQYIGEVFDQLVAGGALAAKPKSWRVVLSAHSGGGHTVRKMLAGGTKAGRPASLRSIVLFEAINAARGKPSREAATLKAFIEGEVARHVAVLSDADRSSADKRAYLATAVSVRAYYNPKGSYAARHVALDKEVAALIDSKAAALGPYAADVRRLYQFIPSAVGHESQVRANLADALASGGAPPSGQGAPPARAVPKAAAASPGPAPTAAAREAAVTADAVAALLPNNVAPMGRTIFTMAVTAGMPRLAAASRVLAGAGERDPIELTDDLFALTHPELGGGRIPKERQDLAAEWRRLRRVYTLPVLASGPAASAKAAATTSAPTGPGKPPAPVVAKPPATVAKPKPSSKGAEPKVKPIPEDKALSEPELAAQYKQLSARVRAEFDRFGGRYKATGFDHYIWMSKLYAKRPEVGNDPVGWLNSLQWGVPFCGQALSGVHAILLERLQAIDERATALASQIRAAGGSVVFEGKFQPRPVTGNKDKLSDHGLGLALHLNYTNNPYIGRDKKTSDLIARIAADAGNDKFWASVKGKGKHTAQDQIEALYRRYASVSDAVAKYFSAIPVMEAAAKQGRLDADGLAELAKRKAERKHLMKTDFAGRDPAKGFFAHTVGVAGDPMLELIKLLTGAARLEWGGAYASKPKDLHHFAAKV